MEWFIIGVYKETSTHQYNEMMHNCIMATLTMDAKLLLTTHQKDYTFHAPLLYKMVMRLAITDSRTTDQQLHHNLGGFVSYMVSCKSDTKRSIGCLMSITQL